MAQHFHFPEMYGIPINAKRCPFCGSERLIAVMVSARVLDDIIFLGQDGGLLLRQVACADCGAAGPLNHEGAIAKEFWNIRRLRSSCEDQPIEDPEHCFQPDMLRARTSDDSRPETCKHCGRTRRAETRYVESPG